MTAKDLFEGNEMHSSYLNVMKNKDMIIQKMTEESKKTFYAELEPKLSRQFTLGENLEKKSVDTFEEEKLKD